MVTVLVYNFKIHIYIYIYIYIYIKCCGCLNIFLEQRVTSKGVTGTSLVAQWLRIRLPMQGTRVWALVREDPTCRGATKPVRHNYWACTLEPASHNYWSPCATTTEARAPRACALQQEKPQQWEACAPQQSSPHSLQLEKARVQQQRPNAAKN